MRVGSVELASLVDSIGEFPDLAEAYPNVSPEDWAPYRELYPELFGRDGWRIPCMSFLVRSGGRTILVDTGTGPPGFWDEAPPEVEGGLLSALAENAVGPEDVDIVFITHVHGDHIGWNTDQSGDVLFPRARYVLHQEAAARARERSDEEPYVARCFQTLVEQKLVEGAAAGTELAPGVAITAFPGHSTGHAGLRISSEGAEAVLIADAIPHPALADQPGWVFDWDLDGEQAGRTRRALVEELVDTETLVACGHYPSGGIGRFVNREGHVVWEPASG